MSDQALKLAVISASTRAESQSLRIAHYVQKRLNLLKIDNDLIDLHQLDLPLLGSPTARDFSADLKAVCQQLAACSGVALVCPEWNGGLPAGLVNFWVYIGDNLAHKPIFALTVSEGRGGAYPLAQLRAFGLKDSRYVTVPDNFILRNCQERFLDSDNPDDEYYQNRIDYSLRLLREYAKALSQVRDSGLIDHQTYQRGI